MEPAIHRKLIVVGDGACGKTSLLISFLRGEFMQDYIPAVYDNYVSDINVEDKHVKLTLYDIGGQYCYDRLRPLSYPGTHIFLICFSIDMPDSLENVKEKWIPEIVHFCSKPPVPYFLIGCKKDLRLDSRTLEWLKKTGQSIVSPEEGKQFAKKIGAGIYLECSAKTGEGITKVFEAAAAVSMHTPDTYTKPRKCVIV